MSIIFPRAGVCAARGRQGCARGCGARRAQGAEGAAGGAHPQGPRDRRPRSRRFAGNHREGSSFGDIRRLTLPRLLTSRRGSFARSIYSITASQVLNNHANVIEMSTNIFCFIFPIGKAKDYSAYSPIYC